MRVEMDGGEWQKIESRGERQVHESKFVWAKYGNTSKQYNV